ncbi:hypothetical protein [Pluralibacter sp.]|uniref:hypothetical protein n=1 Tax=Pluralibacter sp. TaxID=1920032 RepID=UPI0025F8C821|nr:hypothetical protein [Pluralibacter sp.]MBV8042099.1 hypothetical protein [Pluralibacter sp.]
MRSPVMVDGDTLTFIPLFGHRTVIPPPGTAKILGSGHATIDGKKVCVLGDERNVVVPAIYLIPGYTPGQGLITIKELDEEQVMLWCTSDAPVITRGPLLTKFSALFTPTILATISGVPDSPTPSEGKGFLRPSQRWVRAG